MRPFTRRTAPAPDTVLTAAALPRGETVLASGRAGDGTWLLGTRRRLVLVALGVEAAVTSLPWEEVEDAGWDREDSRLRVTAIGAYAAPRPSWSFDLEDPDRLLQLVRERVTASVVLQRREVRSAPFKRSNFTWRLKSFVFSFLRHYYWGFLRSPH